MRDAQKLGSHMTYTTPEGDLVYGIYEILCLERDNIDVSLVYGWPLTAWKQSLVYDLPLNWFLT